MLLSDDSRFTFFDLIAERGYSDVKKNVAQMRAFLNVTGTVVGSLWDGVPLSMLLTSSG